MEIPITARITPELLDSLASKIAHFMKAAGGPEPLMVETPPNPSSQKTDVGSAPEVDAEGTAWNPDLHQTPASRTAAGRWKKRRGRKASAGPGAGTVVGPTAGPGYPGAPGAPVVGPTAGPGAGTVVGPTADPTAGPTADPAVVGPTADPAVVGPTADPDAGPSADPDAGPGAGPSYHVKFHELASVAAVLSNTGLAAKVGAILGGPIEAWIGQPNEAKDQAAAGLVRLAYSEQKWAHVEELLGAEKATKLYYLSATG